MSAESSIEWTDATWGPVTGCTKVSAGCVHCYITRTPPFRMAGRKFRVPGRHDPSCRVVTASDWDRMQETIECTCPDSTAIGATTGVSLHPDRLWTPLQWRKPRRVFVNSMSDLFHKDVPDAYIARVWAVMAAAYQHTFQVLTKRHTRMRSLLSSPRWPEALVATKRWPDDLDPEAPLPNLWLGVSVEDQARADLRIPALMQTPAAVRFLSCEPLLGPIRLRLVEHEGHEGGVHPVHGAWSALDWVIVGGESGPGARPMHPAWARSLRDQCVAAGVPFLFKQWGEWGPDERTDDEGWRHVGPKPIASDPRTLVMHPAGMTALTPDNPFDPWASGHPHWHTVMRRFGKKAAGRLLDGRTWDEYPEGAA